MRTQGKVCHIALLLLPFTPLGTNARGLDSVMHKLLHAEGYSATATYAVTLPQADDDIVYTIRLQQPSPSSYLIDWDVTTPSGPQQGFTSYFDGHFYNFRNKRLQEHHEDWDSIPLKGPRAIQHTVQFASLLPHEIGRTLESMAADTLHYSIRSTGHDDVTEVKVTRMAAGNMTDAEMTYVFDNATGMPREFSAEYNPGAISEQLVHAVYNTQLEPMLPTPLCEENLRARYPDAFENCRQSNFAIENMPGKPLPSFSLPLTFSDSGDRLSYTAGTQAESPTVIVLLDAESALTPRLVEHIRSAAERTVVAPSVIYAFVGRDIDICRTALGGALMDGEKAVHGARSLATDCGAASLPAVMTCDSSGIVKFVTVGLNKHIDTDVIRMITLTSN